MNKLTIEQEVWLAEQLGLTPFVDDDGKVACGVCRYSEPEGDDQNGAYWRERIVEWLGEKHGIAVHCVHTKWFITNGIGGNCLEDTGSYDTRKQALFAAVKRVWESRDERVT